LTCRVIIYRSKVVTKEENNVLGKIFFGGQSLLGFLVAICLVGFLLNKSLLLLDSNSTKPIGEIVDIGEYKVNLWCSEKHKE
jgi:hypothetical protein